MQWNVALATTQGSLLPAERELFAALGPLFGPAREEGLECSWFVRKPPGLRLRLGGRRLPVDIEPRVQRLLDDLTRSGVVRQAFGSVYEPESFSLGGPACVDLVHRYFSQDTTAWLEWRALHTERPLPFTREVLSLAVMVDLVQRCVGPREEIWDVWCNVASAHAPCPTRLDVPAIGLAELESMGGPRLRPVLERHVQAHTELAQGLELRWREGRLGVGRRALLATLAAFHWNRYRIEGPTIARLADAMVRAYDPHRGLRGYEASA